MISYYSSLKLWILPINSIEVILRSSHWRRSAKIFEHNCIFVQNLWKIPVKEFNFSKVANLKPATSMKNWTPSQEFFDWFWHCCRTDFLQNTSQWLPMCAAWKKKNERNEIVCFYCTQSDILPCGIARFTRENKNKLRTFQPHK